MKDKLKKMLKYSWVWSIVLLFLTAVCLVTVLMSNNQASVALPLQQTFSGEYSRDGETWYPLEEDSDLSALKGDLYLRGRLSCDVVGDGRLYYYQDHIGVAIYINGELGYEDTISGLVTHGVELEPSMCGSQWGYFQSPGITTEDEIEIHLCNPHSHGNADAYREFLDTLYNSPNTSFILESYLKSYSNVLQIAGMMLAIMALMLLGAALAAGILRIPMGNLWKYGLLTLFIGGFVILDTIGISFVSEIVVLNTYGRQLCIMLAVYCVGLCSCDFLTGKPRTAAQAAMLLSTLLDGVLIVLSFTGVMLIYDTGIYWTVSQVVLCPVMIACTAVELCRRGKKDRAGLVCSISLMSAVLLDLAGVGRSIYSHGTCTKIVFGLVFVLYVARAVKHVATDHQASIRAKQLEKELEESRIATMLSQIQPHFIYNTLGTVEQLCREQPEVAAQLVHDFSLYLRGNFSELDNAAPIRLSQEMEHVRHYVSIEHIRFPDMEIVFDLRSEDFLLPALSVQPLVENAIKHGLMGLESGGTVTISTYETPTHWCVSVEDNGVGFDPAALRDEQRHIGIRNIRGRLKAMVGGTLTVDSTPGVGTRALIMIPKEEIE